MKKLISVLLTFSIILSAVGTTLFFVSASASPIKTTSINITQTPNMYVPAGTPNTSAKVEDGLLKVNISAYQRHLNDGNLNVRTWYPGYRVVSDGMNNPYYLTTGNKAIVEVTYKVTGNPDGNWGTQIGIGVNDSVGGNETYPLVYKKHTFSDMGNEFTLSAVFTVNEHKAIKVLFSGGGKVEISKIIIHELPSDEINNFAVVKFADNGTETTEFVKKNAPLNRPAKDEYIFKGWYNSESFSGSEVTQVSSDSTLYAKWEADSSRVTVNFVDNAGNGTLQKKYNVGDSIDYVPSRQGYNFLGWYKYKEFYGSPIEAAESGITTLYAKWEEVDPKTDIPVDMTKNTELKTTGKTAESTVTLNGEKLEFNIKNYERRLSNTNTANADSWFPSYYLKGPDDEVIQLTEGTDYEISVNYKVVKVAAGDDYGLQIGIGADHQKRREPLQNQGLQGS